MTLGSVSQRYPSVASWQLDDAGHHARVPRRNPCDQSKRLAQGVALDVHALAVQHEAPFHRDPVRTACHHQSALPVHCCSPQTVLHCTTAVACRGIQRPRHASWQVHSPYPKWNSTGCAHLLRVPMHRYALMPIACLAAPSRTHALRHLPQPLVSTSDAGTETRRAPAVFGHGHEHCSTTDEHSCS